MHTRITEQAHIDVNYEIGLFVPAVDLPAQFCWAKEIIIYVIYVILKTKKKREKKIKKKREIPTLDMT